MLTNRKLLELKVTYVQAVLHASLHYWQFYLVNLTESRWFRLFIGIICHLGSVLCQLMTIWIQMWSLSSCKLYFKNNQVCHNSQWWHLVTTCTFVMNKSDSLFWQWIPSKPIGHLQTYSLKTSPLRELAMISQTPSFLQGFGLQGPESKVHVRKALPQLKWIQVTFAHTVSLLN